MLRYQDIAHNKARVRSLTSLDPDEFAALVPVFERCFLAWMQTHTMDGLPRLNRRYTPYKNSPLPTSEDKLLFMLVHIKQHLTQDVHGQLFGMGQSDTNKWLQLLRPILHQALQQIDVLPARLATIIAEPDPPPAETTPFFIMMVRNVPSNDR
jgi:hypothetical protein